MQRQVSVAQALCGDNSSPTWRERLKIERPAGQGKAANPAALHSYTGHDQTAKLTLTATYGPQAANRYALPIHALHYAHSLCGGQCLTEVKVVGWLDLNTAPGGEEGEGGTAKVLKSR